MTERDEPREGEWAKPVEHLDVGDLPDDALNLNVQGRALSGAIQGFGPLWQKTYRIRLEAADVTPQELISVWKAEYPSFWPDNANMYSAMSRLEPGDVGVINASQSGLKLSTGVYVMYSDEVSFAFRGSSGSHAVRLDHVQRRRGGGHNGGSSPALLPAKRSSVRRGVQAVFRS